MPLAPSILGMFKDLALTVLISLRYLATTSQIGSPPTALASSATGAQPATLYVLLGSISLPFYIMLLIRLPASPVGLMAYCKPPTRTMSPPCW